MWDDGLGCPSRLSLSPRSLRHLWHRRENRAQERGESRESVVRLFDENTIHRPFGEKLCHEFISGVLQFISRAFPPAAGTMYNTASKQNNIVILSFMCLSYYSLFPGFLTCVLSAGLGGGAVPGFCGDIISKCCRAVGKISSSPL